MSRLPRPCVCLVTDRRLCQDRSLEEKVALAIEGGVNMVQLREKDLPGSPLLEMANRLRAITQGKALFFVNERLDVALACEADGVQLGEEALPVATVRDLTGDRLLIGRSVHSLEGALEAEKAGADFIQLGTIFESRSKPGVIPAGLELVKEVTSQVAIPVIGIGGIDASNASQVVERGAWGVAVISAILASPNPKTTAEGLMEAVKKMVAISPAHGELVEPNERAGNTVTFEMDPKSALTLSSQGVRHLISVVINGKKREMEGPLDLPTFLASNQLDTRFLAVAHNGTILAKEEYAQVLLKDGDTLEIVRPVGGG